MGGIGSGQWGSKATTESQQIRIDIRWLKRQGYLIPGGTGSMTWSQGGEQTASIGFQMRQNQIILSYRRKSDDDEWEEVEQNIWFDRTPCNYGGNRIWFKCPRCRRRVAILYGAIKYFFCRHCYGLTYTTQQLSPKDRLMEKARKIRRRMGGGSDMFEPFPGKPKGMHWKTYWMLREKAEQADELAWMLVGQRLGLSF